MPNCTSELHNYFTRKFDEAPKDKHFDVGKAKAMVLAYTSKYQEDGYRTLAIEEPFCLPIINPHTHKPSGYFYSGIVDCVLQDQQGGIWFCDHKTVSAGSLNENYWIDLKTNAQLTQYALAAAQMDIPIRGFLWDVIKKPTISPLKKLTKKAVKSLEEDGLYCNIYVGDHWHGEGYETPHLYTTRLLCEYFDNSNQCFVRNTFYRTAEQLLEYAHELFQLAKEADAVSKNPTFQVRNLGACRAYGSLCEFHQLCSGAESIDTTQLYGTRKARESDSERLQFVSGSYSPSRLNTFQQCRRKFAYHYVKDLEKIHREYSDSLEIGSMVHEALEIFLTAKMAPESDRISFKAECLRQIELAQKGSD